MINFDKYKALRLEEIEREEGAELFCEAEADLIIEEEIKNMKIAKLTLYAEAYYSHATYEETLFTNYDLVKHLEGEEIYVGELDVRGELSIEIVDEDYFKNNFKVENDGDHLYWHLIEVNNLHEDIFINPIFGKVKEEIICTQEQWKLILGGGF